MKDTLNQGYMCGFLSGMCFSAYHRTLSIVSQFFPYVYGTSIIDAPITLSRADEVGLSFGNVHNPTSHSVSLLAHGRSSHLHQTSPFPVSDTT